MVLFINTASNDNNLATVLPKLRNFGNIERLLKLDSYSHLHPIGGRCVKCNELLTRVSCQVMSSYSMLSVFAKCLGNQISLKRTTAIVAFLFRGKQKARSNGKKDKSETVGKSRSPERSGSRWSK